MNHIAGMDDDSGPAAQTQHGPNIRMPLCRLQQQRGTSPLVRRPLQQPRRAACALLHALRAPKASRLARGRASLQAMPASAGQAGHSGPSAKVARSIPVTRMAKLCSLWYLSK